MYCQFTPPTNACNERLDVLALLTGRTFNDVPIFTEISNVFIGKPTIETYLRGRRKLVFHVW